jgi:glyoxylase-like metal-dependent hydrolase (beta-lactamase superfamily II)
MTLDGTRTYIIGRTRVAVIDPGPALPAHIDAVAHAIGEHATACILLTHTHSDHDEAAPGLAARLGAEILTPADGAVIATDAGPLTALHTPGHTPDHLSFLLEATREVFCGDLMTGGMDTALVAPPEGDLRAYLHSLERLRALAPARIYPAHGPAFEQPQVSIDRYVHHRMERIEQVLAALRQGAGSAAELVDRVYGSELDARLRPYAESAVEAYLAYLEDAGSVEHDNGEWSVA